MRILKKLLQIYYRNGTQNQYCFEQRTMDFWLGYNTEDIDYESVTVNRYSGVMYVQNNQRHIQWQQDGYVFEVSGKQDIDILKKLAASVKPMED